MNVSADSIALLRQQLTSDSILTAEEISERYSVDFTGENAQMPLAVIRPGSTEEVALILRTCSELSLSLIHI